MNLQEHIRRILREDRYKGYKRFLKDNVFTDFPNYVINDMFRESGDMDYSQVQGMNKNQIIDYFLNGEGKRYFDRWGGYKGKEVKVVKIEWEDLVEPLQKFLKNKMSGDNPLFLDSREKIVKLMEREPNLGNGDNEPIQIKYNEDGKIEDISGGHHRTYAAFKLNKFNPILMKAYVDDSNMNLQEHIRRMLRESTTGDTPTTAINNKTPEKLVNREVKLKGDVNTTSKIKKINVNLDGSIKVDLQNGMKLNLSQRRLNDINFELDVPIEFIIKKKKNTLNESKKNKFASMEKSIANLVRMGLENYKLPENFHDVAVDITKSFGRLTCNVTFLFKKSFDMKDSDKMYVVGKEQIENIKDFYGKKFKITIGNSTIDSYEGFRHIYDQEKQNLDESENKKSRLLLTIEEDGLYQIMQDTGLSLPQIYTKTGELSREVLERYIKDFINADGYHATIGEVQMGYSVELSHNKYIEHFYLEDGKITVELNEYGKYGMQTSGFIEKISNLSDEEIFTIVDDMARDWRM